MESKHIATLLRAKDPVKYKEIIDKAASEYYNDYKSPHIFPKQVLVNDLDKFPELAALRQDVIHGKYDDQADTADIDEMRAEFLSGNAPDETFRIFGFPIPTPDERLTKKINRQN